MSRCIVTGLGFIGTHLVQRLQHEGHEVLAIDRVPPKIQNVPYLEADLSVWYPSVAMAVVDDIDVIFHLAGASDINQISENPLDVISSTIMATANLLDMARHSEKKPRFIYASSTYVYSDKGHIYSTLKRACEGLVKNWYTLYGVPYTILRFGTVYGPNSRSVVGIFVKKALAGEALTIHGEGKQERRFVFIDDITKMCINAMDERAAFGEYTIVGPESVSVRGIAEAVHLEVDRLHILPAGIAGIVEQPAREDDYIEELPDEDKLTVGDISIEEGIKRYVEWQRSQ